MEIEQDLLRVSFTLVRFAAFSANALIFGAIPLLMLVLRPAFKTLEAESWRPGRMNLAVRLEGLIRASLVASAVATVLALLLQTSLVSLLDEGDVGLDALETVLATSFGIWNLVRPPVLGALSVLLYQRVQDVCLSGMAASEKRPGTAWWWGLGGSARGRVGRGTRGGIEPGVGGTGQRRRPARRRIGVVRGHRDS